MRIDYKSKYIKIEVSTWGGCWITITPFHADYKSKKDSIKQDINKFYLQCNIS